jgi:hypothetical protein
LVLVFSPLLAFHIGFFFLVSDLVLVFSPLLLSPTSIAIQYYFNLPFRWIQSVSGFRLFQSQRCNIPINPIASRRSGGVEFSVSAITPPQPAGSSSPQSMDPLLWLGPICEWRRLA